MLSFIEMNLTFNDCLTKYKFNVSFSLVQLCLVSL